eukprot:TRINITY_DN8068_c0_g1_i1.p1 TRINITY_DN8068_c0_g1~~TRINITY_DN8068_c0_g1_i1.p1  ORF type:complete len:447 (+),score=53.72 TRINITY_DN8068_c0_g1_i1:49-1389(+)
MVHCTQPHTAHVSEPDAPVAVWSCVQASGRLPHKCCCLTAVPFRGSLFFYGGGVIKKIYEELFEFEIDSQTWRAVPTSGYPVLPTLSHTAVLFDNFMVVFGGMADGRCHNNLYALDLEKMEWQLLKSVRTAPPSCRKGHTAVVYKRKMYVLMGAEYSGNIHNDLYAFDFDNQEWECLENHPAPRPHRPVNGRTGHSAVEHGGNMYVFGGMTETGATCTWMNDLHAYNLDTRTWCAIDVQPGPMPCGRYSHTAWAGPSSMYIFGGDSSDCSVYYNDMWALDFETMRWRPVKCQGDRPSRRSGHAAAVSNGIVYLFGGEKPVDGKLSEVAYSNTIYQLPLFIDRQTTLKEILTRFMVTHQVLQKTEPEQRAALPCTVLDAIDRLQPKRRRVQHHEQSDSDSELDGLPPLKPIPRSSPPLSRASTPSPCQPLPPPHSPPVSWDSLLASL